MRLKRRSAYRHDRSKTTRKYIAIAVAGIVVVATAGLLYRSANLGWIFPGLGGPAPTPDKLECPKELTCTFRPAFFGQADPNDPKKYGNIDPVNRPKDMEVRYIVIHSTEGSYERSMDWFQNPSAQVASHYIIRSSDGEVTQMVKNKDIAWHAGNRYMNMHSIGIEHEGYMADGATWYTDAMYRSSAALVRYLAERYDIPLDREHIIGHDQYHDLDTLGSMEMHNDPGPYWNWEYYMELLGIKPEPSSERSQVVMVAPPFAGNKPEVTSCESGCGPLPEQSANFVYVRSKPGSDAPLVSDALLGAPNEAGTTDIEDWGARAMYGQRFVVAGRKGDWVAIWFGGQKGWVHNPVVHGVRVLQSSKAMLVTPKKGKDTIPIYGRPLPEKSAYTNGTPEQKLESLHYTMPANQYYVAYEKSAPNDYYHMETYDRSTPGDGQLIVGKDEYIPIAFNKRQAYVRASDVDIID